MGLCWCAGENPQFLERRLNTIRKTGIGKTKADKIDTGSRRWSLSCLVGEEGVKGMGLGWQGKGPPFTPLYTPMNRSKYTQAHNATHIYTHGYAYAQHCTQHCLAPSCFHRLWTHPGMALAPRACGNVVRVWHQLLSPKRFESDHPPTQGGPLCQSILLAKLHCAPQNGDQLAKDAEGGKKETEWPNPE